MAATVGRMLMTSGRFSDVIGRHAPSAWAAGTCGVYRLITTSASALQQEDAPGPDLGGDNLGRKGKDVRSGTGGFPGEETGKHAPRKISSALC